MLPPERRLGRVMELIEQGRYFTLHAGRQTGKTTSARWLVKHYNEAGEYSALWIDLESARDEPDPHRAFVTVLGAFDRAMKRTLPDLGVPADGIASSPILRARCSPTSRIWPAALPVRWWCSSTRPTAWWAGAWCRS
jgi:hypothetical protein